MVTKLNFRTEAGIERSADWLNDLDQDWALDLDEKVDTSDFQDYELVNNVDDAFGDWE